MLFSIKESKYPKKGKYDIKYLTSSIFFVFSLATLTIFLFFIGGEKVEKTEYDGGEISEVFKETFFYDFLELDECDEGKTSGEVSKFIGNLEFTIK